MQVMDLHLQGCRGICYWNDYMLWSGAAGCIFQQVLFLCDGNNSTPNLSEIDL